MLVLPRGVVGLGQVALGWAGQRGIPRVAAGTTRTSISARWLGPSLLWLDLSSPWVLIFHEATDAGLVCHRFPPQARSVISTEWLLYYHGRFGVCNPSVGHPSVHPVRPTLNLKASTVELQNLSEQRRLSARSTISRGQALAAAQVPERADVANDSDVETFCALRLLIDSWRWGGGTLAYLNAIEQVGVVHAPRQSRSSRAAQRGFIPTTRSRTP